MANNPGIWMDHCHNLKHSADGMVAHLMYEGFGHALSDRWASGQPAGVKRRGRSRDAHFRFGNTNSIGSAGGDGGLSSSERAGRKAAKALITPDRLTRKLSSTGIVEPHLRSDRGTWVNSERQLAGAST